jgi:type 1 glutamine amidotransferase
LASGLQKVKPRAKKGQPAPADAKETEVSSVVAWTNEYGPKNTRIFSTTIGHNTETVQDARYQQLITRALLWVTGKLSDQGQPAEGYAK